MPFDLQASSSSTGLGSGESSGNSDLVREPVFWIAIVLAGIIIGMLVYCLKKAGGCSRTVVVPVRKDSDNAPHPVGDVVDVEQGKEAVGDDVSVISNVTRNNGDLGKENNPAAIPTEAASPTSPLSPASPYLVSPAVPLKNSVKKEAPAARENPDDVSPVAPAARSPRIAFAAASGAGFSR